MSEELYHYGVKGMKWGVRKSRYSPSNRIRTRIRNTQTPNPRYSKQLRTQDSVYGKRNVKRINRKMNEGKSHKRAQREVLYGKRGADRIEKRISKGQKVSTAEMKEVGVAALKAAGLSTLLSAATYGYMYYHSYPGGRERMNTKARDAGKWVGEYSRTARYKAQDILHGAHIIDSGDKVSVSDIPIDIMVEIVKR